jgi:hypothetical protein
MRKEASLCFTLGGRSSSLLRKKKISARFAEKFEIVNGVSNNKDFLKYLVGY